MREDARWLAVYGAAFVWEGTQGQCLDRKDALELRAMAERVADIELSTRSEHPFPKEP